MTRRSAAYVEDTPPDLVNEPLNWLFAEHHRHRRLCALLDSLAASAVYDENKVAWACDFLDRDLPLHVIDEEEDLFPLLHRRATAEDELELILDRLCREHRTDGDAAGRAAESLKRSLETACAPGLDPAARRALCQFAAQKRRHIAVENAVILPLARLRLTSQDLEALSVRMAARRGRHALLTPPAFRPGALGAHARCA